MPLVVPISAARPRTTSLERTAASSSARSNRPCARSPEVSTADSAASDEHMPSVGKRVQVRTPVRPSRRPASSALTPAPNAVTAPQAVIATRIDYAAAFATAAVLRASSA
ncbi:MAG: hypothetical protein QM723_02910 [Myxococcaceae bacterium]